MDSHSGIRSGRWNRNSTAWETLGRDPVEPGGDLGQVLGVDARQEAGGERLDVGVAEHPLHVGRHVGQLAVIEAEPRHQHRQGRHQPVDEGVRLAQLVEGGKLQVAGPFQDHAIARRDGGAGSRRRGDEPGGHNPPARTNQGNWLASVPARGCVRRPRAATGPRPPHPEPLRRTRRGRPRSSRSGSNGFRPGAAYSAACRPRKGSSGWTAPAGPNRGRPRGDHRPVPSTFMASTSAALAVLLENARDQLAVLLVQCPLEQGPTRGIQRRALRWAVADPHDHGQPALRTAATPNAVVAFPSCLSAVRRNSARAWDRRRHPRGPAPSATTPARRPNRPSPPAPRPPARAAAGPPGPRRRAKWRRRRRPRRLPARGRRGASPAVARVGRRRPTSPLLHRAAHATPWPTDPIRFGQPGLPESDAHPFDGRTVLLSDCMGI